MDKCRSPDTGLRRPTFVHRCSPKSRRPGGSSCCNRDMRVRDARAPRARPARRHRSRARGWLARRCGGLWTNVGHPTAGRGDRHSSIGAHRSRAGPASRPAAIETCGAAMRARLEHDRLVVIARDPEAGWRDAACARKSCQRGDLAGRPAESRRTGPRCTLAPSTTRWQVCAPPPRTSPHHGCARAFLSSVPQLVGRSSMPTPQPGAVSSIKFGGHRW